MGELTVRDYYGVVVRGVKTQEFRTGDGRQYDVMLGRLARRIEPWMAGTAVALFPYGARVRVMAVPDYPRVDQNGLPVLEHFYGNIQGYLTSAEDRPYE